MSKNKNAQLRYRVLDKCFSNQFKQYNILDLVKEVNHEYSYLYGKDLWDEKRVEEGNGYVPRQLREDIKSMKDLYAAPIKAITYDGKKCYYQYEDPDFTIFKSELSSKEISNLSSTIEMLGKYRGLPDYGWLEEVISNLEYRFGIKSNSEHIVSFDQNEKLKGLEHMASIIDAISNHQALHMVYMTYSGKEISSTIHPYHLKQYNNRWFLFGLESIGKGKNRIANKALDRIVKFTVSSKRYVPSTVDFSTFFNDIVGVTYSYDKEVSVVRLKFKKERFQYIISKPIHHSQIIVDELNGIVELKVKLNKELEAEILRFGPDCEVLAPSELREQIKTKYEQANKIYSSMQNECTER